MDAHPPIPPPPTRLRRAWEHVSNFLIGLWGICWLTLTAVTIVWDYLRSRYLLNRWAADNAFKLAHREYRILRRGPFFHAPRRGHTVHYIAVRDRHDVLHTGFARCGGLWRALVHGAVEIQWDPPSS